MLKIYCLDVIRIEMQIKAQKTENHAKTLMVVGFNSKNKAQH